MPRQGARWALNLTRNDYYAIRKAAEEAKKKKKRRTSGFFFGGTAQKEKEQPAKPVPAGPPPVCEVVQWAPTYGSNARSGLYGVIVFAGKKKTAAPAKPKKKRP